MNKPPFSFEDGAATHTGCIRSHNEDRFLRKPRSGVWVVADGMGGHEAGDFASEAIVDSVTSIGLPSSAPDLQARFAERITRAHGVIRQRSEDLGGATVGATLVALLIFEDSFACIWSGDSRIYRLRDGELGQVTVDHTEAQELLDAGSITPEQAANWPRKNVITRAIGVSDSPKLAEKYGHLTEGDVFLLCSDGLTEHVEDAEIAEALASSGAQAACDNLVALTLERGAKDNVTIVVIHCLPQKEERLAQDVTLPPTDIDWSIGN
ncbi:MAG: protein phosphatase 2C domain-containing protein [Pseudomonadota bacterium]